MKVCIIVPMYNEEGIASSSLETIISYVKTLPFVTTVLVVDDGSRDATPTIVKDVMHTDAGKCVQLVSHEVNKGYGAALKTGMRFAIDGGYDYALFMDSDLTNHPKHLAAFYEKMRQGCAYIKATRYVHGGGMEGVPWRRRLFSHIGNRIARMLSRLPLTDPTNGFRAVHVSIVRQLDLRENDFSIIMEELSQVKRLTKSFCEVPYVLTNRKKGAGITHFSYSWSLMKKYLYYAAR